jgi:oxepin-CoA hydrolase/3-oxo-5,6-dehydrosuberyl-CoA semialdehyde dehydrogenase
VLAPGVDEDSETFGLFLRDVVREMTQKSGQKCTAVRRIFVPADRIDDVQAELAARLGDTVTGNPRDESVSMGPLATAQQLDDVVQRTAALTASEARIVHGTGERVDGVGSDPGKGYFFAPALLRCDDPQSADLLHREEVFGPVATIAPYDGSAATAAALVARAQGTLVSSVYGDDLEWTGELLSHGASQSGRWYLGSEKMAEQAFGSGIAMAQSMHGGPGRAGGGAELGGLEGVRLYSQKVALQGSRFMIDKLFGESSSSS